MDLVGNLLCQDWASYVSVKGKARHLASSETPWKSIHVRKTSIWVVGSPLPLFKGIFIILKFMGNGAAITTSLNIEV